MIAALERYGKGLSRRVGRALRRRIQPNALVLVYHRIAEPVDPDPWGLCVAPVRFAEQLEVLKRETDVVPLAELRRAARRGFGRPRVALTFDDGYADALHRALPPLERHGLPATVFVPTGLVVEVPAGMFLAVFARSSTPLKRGLMVANGVGVVDSDYCGPRDELKVPVVNITSSPVEVRTGDRIAQGIVLPAPRVTWEEVTEVTGESRGGFGATG